MKNRLNSTFFGICFLAALLGEEYCLLVLKGDPVSTIGLGIVVLITAYLLLDSIGSKYKQDKEEYKRYTEMIKEDRAKWDEKCTEMINLQKATYTALKKNTLTLSLQLEQVMRKMESLEQQKKEATSKSDQEQ